MDNDNGALRDQPGAFGSPATKPFLHTFRRGLARGTFDRSADDVDAAPVETVVVRMPPETRGPEVTDSATAVREWSGRMFGEECPHVEILYAVPLANEMLGTSLAEAKHK